MNIIRSSRSDTVRDAIDRDLRDQERLAHIDALVAELLDALIPDMHDLEHPDARWHPADLVDVLQDQRKSLKWELQRVSRGPVVIDQSDYLERS